MKKLVLFALLSICMTGLVAQRGGSAPLSRGDKQINFGLGFSNHGLPVYGSLDIGVHPDITITPEVHMVLPFAGHDNFGGGILVKADYHWNYLIGIPREWDFYAGVRAGVGFDGDVWPELGLQVGGRWYWSDRWGLNLEIAGGTGFGTTFGLSYIL